jgi:sugar/nucleoside kinase (ribokinase family)
MPGDEPTYDVLCYGTISTDNVTHLSALPNPRRDAPASAEYDVIGGEALQVAVPLAAWGLKVLVVGNVIGADRKGRFILERLADHPNVDTRCIEEHPNVVTPFSRILVTPDGERSRIAYWYDQTPKVELTPEIMARARLLSVDAYGRDERDRAAAVAHKLGRPVISADAIWPRYPLAGLSDVVVISSVWLRTNFPGVYEYDHALELQARGAGTVIITDGSHPVLVVREDGSTFGVEPYDVPRLRDTSGAGAVFKAGIIYGWLQPHWPLERRVKFASAAAGLHCTLERPMSSPPTLGAIQALMQAQPR